MTPSAKSTAIRPKQNHAEATPPPSADARHRARKRPQGVTTAESLRSRGRREPPVSSEVTSRNSAYARRPDARPPGNRPRTRASARARRAAAGSGRQHHRRHHRRPDPEVPAEPAEVGAGALCPCPAYARPWRAPRRRGLSHASQPCRASGHKQDQRGSGRRASLVLVVSAGPELRGVAPSSSSGARGRAIGSSSSRRRGRGRKPNSTRRRPMKPGPSPSPCIPRRVAVRRPLTIGARRLDDRPPPVPALYSAPSRCSSYENRDPRIVEFKPMRTRSHPAPP